MDVGAISIGYSSLINVFAITGRMMLRRSHARRYGQHYFVPVWPILQSSFTVSTIDIVQAATDNDPGANMFELVAVIWLLIAQEHRCCFVFHFLLTVTY